MQIVREHPLQKLDKAVKIQFLSDFHGFIVELIFRKFYFETALFCSLSNVGCGTSGEDATHQTFILEQFKPDCRHTDFLKAGTKRMQIKPVRHGCCRG